jgi:putative endonuclease
VTNALANRIAQHKSDALSEKKTFAGKYNCCHLVYMEHHKYILNAIAREKELKGWTRERKEELIKSLNPEWAFLNEDW